MAVWEAIVSGWTAGMGNRRFRGLEPIRGRLPPAGLPGFLEIAKEVRGAWRRRTARMEGKRNALACVEVGEGDGVGAVIGRCRGG